MGTLHRRISGNKVKFTVLATGFGIKDVPGMDNMLNKRTIEEQKKLEEQEEEEQRKDERRGDYYGRDTFKNSNKKNATTSIYSVWKTLIMMTSSAWWKQLPLISAPRPCLKASNPKP